MRRRTVWMGILVATMTASLSAIPGTSHANAPGVAKTACDVPAGEPAVGSPEWQQRDEQNVLCAGQKVYIDQTQPSYGAKANSELPADYAHTMIHQVACGEFGVANCPVAVPVWVDIPGATVSDPYRMPDEWAAAGRGNTTSFYFNKCDGTRLAARMFWPNEAFAGPKPAAGWPGIAISTGSVQAFKEIYFWAGEGLAEAGYMVLMYDVDGQGQSDTSANAASAITPCDATQFNGTMKDALDFLESGPGNARPSPNPGTLAFNPRRSLLDASKIGIAGHSAGAAAVSAVGQERPDVKAVVAWDCLSALSPANLAIVHAPALGICSEYLFNQTVATAAPNPDAKATAFNQIVAHNQDIRDGKTEGNIVDTMSVIPRSSTHLEYDYVPYTFPSSRYGERTAFYYTLNWFDRYVKGDTSATERLTATRFDDSADHSAIGAGTYDSVANANVPYKLAGDCTSNRLSFYYKSRFNLEGGALSNGDMQHMEPNTDPTTYCGTIPAGVLPL